MRITQQMNGRHGGAAASTSNVPHLQEQLPHVGESHLFVPVLLQTPRLPSGDQVALERALLSEERAHVDNEGLGDLGR
jgi:hypothetical protein